MEDEEERIRERQSDAGVYRVLVEGITDYAIYMLDPEGYVVSWNPGAQRFKGYVESEILGHHFSCFYSKEDSEAGLADLALKRAAEEGLAASISDELDAIIAMQEGSKDSPENFTIADDAFHRTVANGIRMGDIWSLLEREKAQFDRLRFLSLPNVTPVELLIEQHKAMLSAVKRRDPIAAEAAVHVHLSEVLKVTEHLAQRYSDLIVNDL